MNEFKGSKDYVASEELLRAANIAMVLQKPLLIKGEPGTGKTVLAEAISAAMGKKLIIWNIKSTTKAQDGLYVYDVVQRLYDSQFGGKDVENVEQYVKLGKLGDAFTADEQVILLIDEIDKADLEFPNDLLWELDRMEFHIPETGKTITAKHRPVVIITSNAEKELPDAFLRRCVFHYIEFPNDLLWELDRMEFNIPETGKTITAKKRPVVIITSNAEKELPDAFLRRCVFHYIDFPNQELMADIVRVHYPDLDERLLTQVLEAFYKIRSMPQIKKKPSTSEIIDWIQALQHGGVDVSRIVKEVPYVGVLLKKNEDTDALRKFWR